ncbi:hypothetical protein X797_003444 [Metarhizium robertsii]|uniref:Uncharacterized protein n=1 Tax=Metarhizium robertsii TaxID=568076 RepID=A0A0A1V0G9_9HYPO|nr:hypothetical protein X797_003444 [Metarhizium robertsii]
MYGVPLTPSDEVLESGAKMQGHVCQQARFLLIVAHLRPEFPRSQAPSDHVVGILPAGARASNAPFIGARGGGVGCTCLAHLAAPSRRGGLRSSRSSDFRARATEISIDRLTLAQVMHGAMSCLMDKYRCHLASLAIDKKGDTIKSCLMRCGLHTTFLA